MDNTAQMAVCYLPIRTIPPFISEYVKSQRLNQMQTLLASLGIAVRDVYVDEGFEQAPAGKPGLKRILDRLLKKEFDVFVVNSVYDLGDHFLECMKTLEYLVEHHIRVICLDNRIDSAADASFIEHITQSCR